MNCFLIASSDITHDVIDAKYPRNYVVGEGVWVIATDGLTLSNNVSDSLQFEPEINNGLVVKITEYYGCHDVALWNSLSTWMKADG